MFIWKVETIFKIHVTNKYNIFAANEDSFPPVVKPLVLKIIEVKIWKAETFGLHNIRFYYHPGVRSHFRSILKSQ